MILDFGPMISTILLLLIIMIMITTMRPDNASLPTNNRDLPDSITYQTL